MNSLNEADLTAACGAYAVANTPYFLIRKLRQDPIVSEIARSFSADVLFAELGRALEARPDDSVGWVRPYVYLVALAMAGQDQKLREAADLPNANRWDWFDHMRRVLLETSSPVTSRVLSVPGQLLAPMLSIRTDAPLDEEKIILSTR